MPKVNVKRRKIDVSQESSDENFVDGGPRNEEKVVSQSSSSQGSNCRWNIPAGVIISVKLQNFMCHQRFVYEPSPQLNFLNGENGSGKSAILTAVVFVLGGTAATANRGRSIKAFIRNGENSATVEITLFNKGENAFKPEIYGDKITISRTVTTSSGSYKFKDAHGRLVKPKKVREELDRMLEQFGIQINNPIAILTQDTAKQFLFKCDPKKLYQFFTKSTQLDKCKQDYDETAEERYVIKEIYKQKKANAEGLVKEHQKWQRRLELKKLELDRTEVFRRKNAEIAWCAVKGNEEEVNSQEEKMSILKKKMGQCQQKVDTASDRKKEIVAEKTTLEVKLREGVQKIKHDMTELEVLRDEAKNASKIARTKASCYIEIQNKLQRKEDNANDLKIEIERLKDGTDANHDQVKKQRDEEIRELEDHIKLHRRQLDTCENENLNLNNTVDKIRADLNQIKYQRNALNQQMKVKKAEIDRLNKSNDRLHLFGEKMPKLVAEINRNINKFKKTPIGPLGAKIDLKSNVSERQAAIVEHQIKNLMTTFIVDNFEDQKQLQQLMGQCQARYAIITTKFDVPVYDIASGKCEHEFPTIFDLLQVSNQTVMNCLVDQVKIEKILVVPEERQAQDLLKKQHTVPANCLYAITHDLTQYYPAPRYRTYDLKSGNPNQLRGRTLKANVEDMVKTMIDEMREIKLKIQELEKEVPELEANEAEKRTEMRLGEKNMVELKQQVRQANIKLSELKTLAETEKPPNIAALEDDYDRYCEEMKKLREEMNELWMKKEDFEAKATNARAKHEAAKANFESQEEQIEPMKEQVKELSRQVAQIEKEKNDKMAKLREYEAKMRECEQDMIQKQRRVEAATQAARKFSAERIDTDKAFTVLEQELKQIKTLMNQGQSIKESVDELKKKCRESQESLESASSYLVALKNQVHKLSHILSSRADGFKTLRASVSNRVSLLFSAYLNSRNFSGSLQLDHDEQTLTLKVYPEGRGTELKSRGMKTLSGGERSYSTISLVLSLWELMNPPFRLLDEFDVFMDSVNRRMSLNQITNYATGARTFQYVLLTPLNLDGVDIIDEIRIIKLMKSQT